MNLEIRHLRAICAIDDEGSLSKAATVLGLTQPSLTLLLQRVETVLGGRLFQRSRSGATPTPLGSVVLDRARLILGELDTFGTDFVRTDQHRPIRLGIWPVSWVNALIDQLDVELPNSSVLVEPSSRKLTQAIRHGHLDIAVIALAYEDAIPGNASLGRRMLLPRLPISVAIARSHPLAATPEIELADLANESWIAPSGSDDGCLTQLHAACRRAGYRPRIRFDIPSGNGTHLISSGKAVRLVEPTGNYPGIKLALLAGEPLSLRVFLVWRRDRVPEDDADRVFRMAARIFQRTALASPDFGPWWRAHPELHPLADKPGLLAGPELEPEPADNPCA
ncbi:transcriptional regulator [Pilimelia anulata]|uniref:Transcriptional regulator n=1 Tax=Pilimelia anulata TaxID=53371 RepID=A0A8J3BEV2_9ACTN|nr:LysR family transcriptional regulator [Pilimelia anulata]GGK09998.1 transcriptional regulator [Pilimelia anulata]